MSAISMIRTLGCAIALSMLAGTAAIAEEDTLDPNRKLLGNDVLDIMEASDTGGESKAMRIIRRAAEIFTDIVVPEEHESEAHSRGHKGHGPPDWAPAHGWRRNFGDQETHDLGGFTRDRIREGLSGAALIVAIRGEIDRVVISASDDDVHGNAKPHNEHPGGKPDDTGKGKPGKGNSGGKSN